jgi:hypothetical protein
MFDPRSRIAGGFRGPWRGGSYLIDAHGMIRLAHEGWDETADATYRQEIVTLLAEWREFPNRN